MSYALVAPISHLLGARGTLIAAGLSSGTILVVALLAVPELREPEPSAP